MRSKKQRWGLYRYDTKEIAAGLERFFGLMKADWMRCRQRRALSPVKNSERNEWRAA